ncbi:HPP family protein [Constrictibacter sp. MBR-5]|uniref:HPP family protein n=1 Tax=Constrictibacter sp. MBR-5 TaxID=3156467 RepID=UPI003397A2DC
MADPLTGELGYGFVLAPVMLDTMLLVALAVLYNRTTGRRYPFRQPKSYGTHATADPAPERRLGLSADDLSTMLDRFNLSANIGDVAPYLPSFITGLCARFGPCGSGLQIRSG